MTLPYIIKHDSKLHILLPNSQIYYDCFEHMPNFKIVKLKICVHKLIELFTYENVLYQKSRKIRKVMFQNDVNFLYHCNFQNILAWSRHMMTV